MLLKQNLNLNFTTMLKSFFELHDTGGTVFMAPITLLALIIIGIAAYILISSFQKKQISDQWLESIKQIGGLAAVWGTWSTLIGLLQAFNAIENSPEEIPFRVICGGMKVALLTVLYGVLVYCFALLFYIILKMFRIGKARE